MNYGVFKNGRYLGEKDEPAIRRHMKRQDNKPRRRLGCAMLLLPVLAILIYFLVSSKM